MNNKKMILYYVILLINIIILILLLLKRNKSEGYQPFPIAGQPDDLVISEILPLLSVEDLLNISRVDSDKNRIVDKFVRQMLGFETVCDLSKMQYFHTIPELVGLPSDPPKEWIGAKFAADFSFNFMRELFEIIKPLPQFKKFIKGSGENELDWVIFNVANVNRVYEDNPNQFSSKINMYHNIYLVNFEDTKKNGVEMIKVNIWIHPRANSEASNNLKGFLDNKFTELNDLKTIKDINPFMMRRGIRNEGTLYTIRLPLQRSDYPEYIQYILNRRQNKGERRFINEVDDLVREMEEKQSSSSSQPVFQPITDEEIESFVNTLKIKSLSTLNEVKEMIGDKTLKRQFNEIVGYLSSDNYSKFRNLFDEEIRLIVRRNPKIFTRENLNLILANLI